MPHPTTRPAPADRAFVSEAVDAFVDEIAGRTADPHAAAMVVNCLPNTLDTTVQFRPDGAPGGGSGGPGGPDTFVITGDIPEMWLRDSAAQVWPYLHLAPRDGHLAMMVEGLIGRQARSILLDPYANAFLRDPAGTDTQWKSDRTDMRPGVYERKWEVDSLAYFLRLSAAYHAVTGERRPFNKTWLDAVELVLETYDVQRGPGAFGAYTFQRVTAQASDTQWVGGRGSPGRPCGLIRSSFRCSDDASIFPYLIPSNLMAAAELERAAGVLDAVGSERAAALAARSRKMGGEVRKAVADHGTAEHPVHGRIFAYEVDGFGSSLLMDDAGIPGLLSLPYLGAVSFEDEIYQNTRRFAWSADNPFYAKGSATDGIGSPHTAHGSVWPMSLLARGLSSPDQSEAAAMVAKVASLDAGTGFVHESLNPNDPADFSRPWFAWVNGLFGELAAKAAGHAVYGTVYGG